MNFEARTTPIYINVRDRVSDLRNLVTWLEEAGHENIIMLDNQSTYLPLLEFFETSSHEVIHLDDNYGAKSLWAAELVPDEWFVYTDPDVLPVEECPTDVVDFLHALLSFYTHSKAGLGFYVEDTPDFRSKDWERALIGITSKQFPNPIVREMQPGVFDSKIDTTFALYRPNARFMIEPAIRTGHPYVMRHLPWYRLATPTEEEQYYLERCIEGPPLGSSWATNQQ
jgi:hypothetical protein